MFQSSLSIITEIHEGCGKTILIDQEFNTLTNEIRTRKIHASAQANNYSGKAGLTSVNQNIIENL